MLETEARTEAQHAEDYGTGVSPQAGGQVSAGPAIPRFRRGSLFWVSIASLAMAAIFGRVALLNLAEGAVGGHVDGYNNIWNYYWLKTALLDLHRNPFYTDYVYYPTGISLRFHTFNPLNGLVAMPFNLTLGYIPTFNLIFVVAPFFTLLFSFLLIRDIVGNPWAAFVGAGIAAYADYHVVVFLTTGQSSYITLQFLPLYFFFLFRALHGIPTWSRDNYELRITNYELGRWPLYVALCIATLLLISLTDWQYLMFAVFTTLLYFAFLLFTRRTWREKARIFGKLALIGGIYALIAAPPLLLPMIGEAAESPWLNVSYQASKHSVDVGWLVNPGIGLGGLIVLGLAVMGLWSVLRGRAGLAMGLFWLLAIVVFYAISLGPVLIVNGVESETRLLYSLLQDLPVFNSGRDPARFTLIATIGTGILAAFGVRALLQRLGVWIATKDEGRRTKNESSHAIGNINHVSRFTFLASGSITTLLVALTLSGVMAASGEAEISPPDWPPFYEQIAQDKETYAILELPLFSDAGRGADHYQMYQVLHEKPRFSGRLARDRKLTNPNNFIKRGSLFRHLWMLQFPENWTDLHYPDQDILKRTDYKTQGLPILNYYNVRYIILYKEAIDPHNWNRMEEVIAQALGEGVRPHYEDRMMRVYRVPDGPTASNPLTLDVGDGWLSTAVAGDGAIYRWADYGTVWRPPDRLPPLISELYTMNLTQQPMRVELRFTAFSYKQGRTLRVMLNGNEVGRVQLEAGEALKQVALELTLPPGNNLLSFDSPEPPIGTGDPKADARLFSFALRDISVENLRR